MGNEQTTQSTSIIQLPAMDAVNKPKPSNFDPKHPPGMGAVDTAAMGPCKANPNAPGCFLDKDQRVALVILYEQHLGAVRENCKHAVSELKVEQFIKNTDELPWYVSLLVAAVAAVLTDGLSVLLEGGIGLASGLALGAEAATTAEAAIANVNVARMRELISITVPSAAAPAVAISKVAARKATDAGTHALTPSLAMAVSSDSEATRDKTAAVGYLDFLRNSMDKEFDQLSKKPLSAATDGELLALYQFFDPQKHSTQLYVAKFRASVDRYVHSHASQIGRKLAWDEKRDNSHVELETHVAWLITKGAGKRLIYVDRAFSATFQRLHHDAPTAFSRSGAYDSETHQLSLQQDATWATPLGQETHHEKPLGPDLMLNYVEPEFVDIALQAQDQVWLAPPETFMLDYSYGAPRMIKVAS